MKFNNVPIEQYWPSTEKEMTQCQDNHRELDGTSAMRK